MFISQFHDKKNKFLCHFFSTKLLKPKATSRSQVKIVQTPMKPNGIYIRDGIRSLTTGPLLKNIAVKLRKFGSYIILFNYYIWNQGIFIGTLVC